MTDLLASVRTYRTLDRASKLVGVALLAAGLQAGATTPTGLVLAATGIALGLLTVFIESEQ
ncbi:MAG: hypothetical protein ABEI96_03660 [Haloarculaceae archaeon]